MQKVKMLKTVNVSLDGIRTIQFIKGNEYDVKEGLLKNLIHDGVVELIETKAVETYENKAVKTAPVRKNAKTKSKKR